MHIRLAALIVVFATLLLSLNSTPSYSQLSASCLGNKGGLTKVVAACTTLMNAEGLTPVQQNALLRARGWAYYCGKRYDKAIVDYNSALKSLPGDSVSLLRRAFVHDVLGNVDAADSDYSEVLQSDPDRISGLFYKSKFDEWQGKHADAMKGYERVLEIDPDYKNVGQYLHRMHHELYGIDGAKEFLKEAKRRWPNQVWVYDTQVQFDLMFSRDHESAMNALTQLAQLKPGIEYEALLPAIVHLKIGIEEEGIKYVKDYAERHLEYDLANRNLIGRWYQKAHSMLVIGQDRQWMYRYLLLAMLERPDLAKKEIAAFLKNSGKNGRRAILRIIRGAGIEVSQEAWAGSVQQLNKAIDEYLDHLGRTSGFRKYGPPERG